MIEIIDSRLKGKLAYIEVVKSGKVYKSPRSTAYIKIKKPEGKVTKPAIRNCLGCQRGFESEGIHNRMCGACKGKS